MPGVMACSASVGGTSTAIDRSTCVVPPSLLAA
jgi:hypothetical protein